MSLGRQSERVIIVGAGVGGLASAITLAAQGLEVEVFERAPTPGGKLREVAVGDARIDAGPTVFTMRWVFEELFAAAGTSLEAELPLQPAEVLARHAWSEQERLDLFADQQRSADAIGQFAGAREAEGFLRFTADARGIFNTLKDAFITNTRTTPAGLMQRVGIGGIGALMNIRPYSKLWPVLGEYFKDPRLQQLFGRYATYCGSSPFLAPATLMLVAHVEQEGVWLIEGGMHRLARTMAGIAERLGVRINYSAPVAEILIEQGRARGVRLDSGETHKAAAVVLNADTAALGAGLFGHAATRALGPTPADKRSLSALTWSLTAETSGFPLVRHSVFFSRDYPKEFQDLLQRRRLPQEPTVYICAQDRSDSGQTTAAGYPVTGPERLLCLVNAPAIGDRHEFTSAEINACAERTVALLSHCGLQLQIHPELIEPTSPTHFNQLFPASGGALYGRASHGWLASFSRPGAHSKVPGLYLAGGSTHPGPGLPMATLSGRLAAQTLLADLPSISPSRRMATSGGTSTR
ncbi:MULTISPECIES: 1-hydroxycarotenoid 3,4-desaturase CrtD [Thiorhodovibrio]|uniref:1-hydroxycarotenoid 3,4-desaturase CrtD n=1 Tax=Thiorhodovibrio TaxID=61593 RepID=UPI00191365CC|nr:1-hydroxycarotenoid 3,4-desaturase CrtD [Thiorhodovibrio litoralis]MBK5967790.1 CrtD protein [Thiorhodovibrio winogradskyi]WPL14405.1 phytoene desaturase family protein [Thiorhodovibrio litoralis]